MKFTDGYWLVRSGFRVWHPAQAYDAEARDGTLVIHAPVRKVSQRGDVLNSPLLTFEVSAPMPDVLKVRITHFSGGRPRKPDFALQAGSPGEPQIRVGPEEASIRSGRLEARFNRGEGPWRVDFLGDGALLTSSEGKSVGYAESQDGKSYLHEQLSLAVGESVYGLGERFSAFVKNGQSVEIWNQDGGTASEQAYKNVPFFLSSRGYGVFVNHPERVSFEVASEKVSRVQFSVEGQWLEYFLFYGPEPKDVLTRYTALTGRPALPPAWSFGLWLSTSFTTSYDEETVTGLIQGMADRGLPLSVFHFDCFWMREFNWCDFQWDARTFPDPPGLLARLAKLGLKICVWINPYIAQRSPLFTEGRERGYLLRKADGDVWQTDLWQAGMGLVDFTNPEAREWYAGKLSALLDMGVDAFKTYFGERVPTDVVWFDGSDPQRMHNFYPYLYNKTVFELLEAKRGEGDAVVFARSATAGCQQFPVHWGGDCESTFAAMSETLRGGLSLGLSGFGFWSHDIGGFEGTPPPALFNRWIAFGLLSSHSRLHGSNSYRVPWVYGEETVEVLRLFTGLKLRLMPYLYRAAVEASRTGVPVMRAMLLEFPADPAVAGLDRQYMLGPNLLVAPVFSEDGTVEYYVPAGTWTDLLSGETRTGPAWFREKHGFRSLPLLVRPGSILPLSERQDRPEADWNQELMLEVYELGDGQSATVELVAPTGKDCGRVTVLRQAARYEVSAEGVTARFRVRLVGVTGAALADGGQVEPDPRGLVLVPASTARDRSMTVKMIA